MEACGNHTGLETKRNAGRGPLDLPISLLPAIARLVERILAEELKTHVNLNDVLPLLQFGFRQFHSCETALTELFSQIAEARDEYGFVVVASLDLAGAFDTVCPSLLLEKLPKVCDVSGPALDLIGNYLSDRFMSV